MPATSGSVPARAVAAALALACAAAGLTIAGAYPVARAAAVAAFCVWTVFAAWRTSFALAAMIALAPVAGFATWTGWMTFEETDLLALATAAGGYLAVATGRTEYDAGARRRGPSIFAIALWALFALAMTIAFVRGVDAAGGLSLARFDWTARYDSAENGVRIFKSIVLASLLAPLLARTLRATGGLARIGGGLAVGLGLVALAVVDERLAFTGLMDFSEDYRVTGPFWEMHVGGAALDGFLALSIPFAVREAMRPGPRWRFVASAAVVALAAYAALVTFSRGVYLAVPLSLAVQFVLVARQRLGVERGVAWAVYGKAVAFALVVAACGGIVFRSGGYRAVLAAYVVLAGALPADDALRRLDLGATLAAVVAAVAAAAIGMLVASVLPKGPYLVFALAAVAGVAAVAHLERAPGRAPSQLASRLAAILVVAVWLWLAAAAALVAGHWGGAPALHDSAVTLAGFVVLVFAASRLPRPVWPASRRERVVTLGVAGLVLAAVAVFAAGAYMGTRFSATNDDLAGRVAHWRDSAARLHGADWLFGKGLGRFPSSSLYEGPSALGADRLVERDGATFVELLQPRARYLGFNEMYRLSQRVALVPHATYVATVEARSRGGHDLHVEVCEKHLIYNGDCRAVDLPMAAGDAWQRYGFRFDSGGVGESSSWARKTVWFAIAADNAVDVREAHLVGPGGVDLVENGDFHDRLAHWFSSSDRFHLPWHAKNLALGLVFDAGAFGLALFALVVLGALVRTALGRAARHPDAPAVAAAIVGYLVVGATDTLLDVPRGALLFWLVTLAGLMLRSPRAARDGPVATPRPAPAPPAAAIADERAARALRRQKAFGERRPREE